MVNHVEEVILSNVRNVFKDLHWSFIVHAYAIDRFACDQDCEVEEIGTSDY